MDALTVFVRGTVPVVLLLSAVLGVVPAEQVPVYFGQGGDLTLTPPVPAAITNIAWKLNNNLVADWEQTGSPTYFGPFKGRTTLDHVTGTLTLTRTTEEDQGLFTLEVNDRVHDVSYSAKMIDPVPTPVVHITPLACDAHAESCSANCNVKGGGSSEGAEPITYSWRKDDGEWKDGFKELVISKAEEKYVKEFFCRMKNPINSSYSEAKKNPLYEVPPEPKPYWIIAVVGAVAAVGAGVFGLWKTKPQLFSGLINRSEPVPAKDSTPDERSPAMDERSPAMGLNGTSGEGSGAV